MNFTNLASSISYKDIQLWLEAANQLIAVDDQVISEVIPGLKKGSILRLPTEAEWEFVAKDRGAANGTWYFGNDGEMLAEHAWFKENSEDVTHPVAEKRPLVISGQEFYDMYGNVWQRTMDANSKILPGGKDPWVAGYDESDRILRGLGWSNHSRWIWGTQRISVDPISTSNNTGFRLVSSAPL